jgi:tetratricopeptide (TPR) repeat protein
MRTRGWQLLCSLAALSACTEIPVTPTPPPPRARAADAQPDQPIAAHRQRALQYKQSGDLAAAAAEWQILTLLAPEDESFRHELDAAHAAIRRGARENVEAGNAALRSGDTERAAQAMLRALALDPENAEAAKVLRDIDRQKLSKIQGDRAARVRQESAPAANRTTRSSPPAPDSNDTYDIEQRLEMFKAGDTTGGLREFRSFVNANPNDRASRQRIGAAVYERARELENKGSREQSLGLYEQAATLRGDTPPDWAARIQSVRKALSDEYYENGVRAYRTDVALAIKHWETSLHYDPQNLKATSRLREARLAQEKLQRIQREAPRN